MKKLINFKLEKEDGWDECSILLTTLKSSISNDIAMRHQKKMREGDLVGFFEEKLWKSIREINGFEAKSLAQFKSQIEGYVFDKLLDEMKELEELSQKEAFRVEESDQRVEDK